MQVRPGSKRDRRARRTGVDGNQHPLLEGVYRAMDDQRSAADLAQGTGHFVSADCSWVEVGFGGLASRKDGVVRGCDITSAVHRDERGHVARLRKSRSRSAKWCQKVRRNELSGTTSPPDAAPDASDGLGGGDEGLHFAHGLLPTDEDGVGDDGVADVQFLDQRQRGDALDVVIVESMTGVDA
jgi:hypothetical protein